MDLSVINTIAIITIIIVVTINFVITAKNYKKIKQEEQILINMNKQISDYIEYLESAIKAYIQSKLEEQTKNILDLDEFNDLDPHIKEIYKQNIVENLMPALMGAINNQYSKIDEAAIKESITQLADKLRKDGFSTPQQVQPQPIVRPIVQSDNQQPLQPRPISRPSNLVELQPLSNSSSNDFSSFPLSK